MHSYFVNGEGRLSSPLLSTGTGPCIHLLQGHLYLQSWPFCICWFGFMPLFLVSRVLLPSVSPFLSFDVFQCQLFVFYLLVFWFPLFLSWCRDFFLLPLSFLCSQVEFGPAPLWAPPGGEFHSSVDTPVLYLKTSSGLHSLPGWSHVGLWQRWTDPILA